VSDLWSERAQLYVDCDAHRFSDDLELLVAWAEGARTALDIATSGGHVARRLRDVGIEVVTCDPARGMHADVVCPAEELPFADGSFDITACRTAAHHFDDVRAAVHEMARVSRERVLIADTLDMGREAEQAEALRDPSPRRVEALWGDRVADGRLTLDKIVTKAVC
jgi:ubiquinone/menaquinone biosynthesis C-methylase UbiE